MALSTGLITPKTNININIITLQHLMLVMKHSKKSIYLHKLTRAL